MLEMDIIWRVSSLSRGTVQNSHYSIRGDDLSWWFKPDLNDIHSQRHAWSDDDCKGEQDRERKRERQRPWGEIQRVKLEIIESNWQSIKRGLSCRAERWVKSLKFPFSWPLFTGYLTFTPTETVIPNCRQTTSLNHLTNSLEHPFESQDWIQVVRY